MLHRATSPIAVLATALFTLCLFFQRPVEAQQVNTIVTDHFRITYFGGASGTARRVAEVAEEVFTPLAAAYNYYDDFRTIHIIIIDNHDLLGNASADPYSNTIYFWATSLDVDLRGSSDYAKNVLTHELTHIITLNKARKKWPFQFALFSISRFDSNPDISFSLPLYHLSAPRGWSEGIAQYGSHKFGYDTWDSHRDMLLRMAVLEDDLLTFNEMGTVQNRTGKNYGEMIYNQGFSMMLYIEQQYGPEKVDELTHHFGSLSFDPAIRRVLGISAKQFYQDWVAYLRDQYDTMSAEIRTQGHVEGQPLDGLNEGVLEFYPSFSPDGTKLAYVTSERRDFAITKLKIYDFQTGRRKELEGFIDSRISWSPEGDEIVFVRNKGGLNDLYIYNFKQDDERRISARLRSKDPAFSPDGKRIAFVHNADGTNNLGLINADGTGLVYLTNNNDGTQYWAPRWSPDGKSLLFNIFRGEDRDIAMIRTDSPPRAKDYGFREKPRKWLQPRARQVATEDTETAEADSAAADSVEIFPDTLAFPHPDTSGFRALVASLADERDPHWLPDGSGFVFSSDQSGIFNIYRYNMENGRTEQLTNVIGGAFSPTVSPEGEIVYVGYHANDYSLYRFDPESAYLHQAQFDMVAARDYQSVYQGPKLSEQFSIGRYSGRKVLNFIPIFQAGPTFVGNTFGLNQVSAGLQFSTGEQLGSEQLTAWAVFGKNFRESTDLNTDFGAYYERSLFPMVGNSRTFNPSFFAAYRRREIDNLLKSSQTVIDTIPAVSLLAPVDSTQSILLPDTQQFIYDVSRREDLFKSSYETATLGINLPLSRSQRLSFQYQRRNYDEDWTLRSFLQANRIFLVQDNIDITDATLPPEQTQQDTALVDPQNSLGFYNGLDFFTSHDLTVAWSYVTISPTADRQINPIGRALSFRYRYMNPTLTDSLAQLTSPDGIPRDQLGPDQLRLRVNEYVASYTERLGLPYNNTLSLRLVGAYNNIRLKDSFNPDGGFFEGRFYWPLRYYLGGPNFLGGYPYFTDSGSKLIYGRIGYSFPLLRRLDLQFLNFTFSKLYGELFAEAGAVGNFDKFDGDWLNPFSDQFTTKDFLTDVGGELRMQLFSFYRIPMTAYLQVVRPLNTDRVEGDIDKWRYYFGFGF